MSYDLIVVGGGTAGMVCAIAAAEHGAHPVVIEKTDDVGGTLHMSSGQLSAAGTRRQRERGIEDHPDRHFDDVMRIGRGAADPALVRLAVDEAARTLDWLEAIGIEFEPETPAIYLGHEPYSIPRTCWGPEGGRSILKVLRRRWDQERAAGRISVLFEHAVQELIVERRTRHWRARVGPGRREDAARACHGPGHRRLRRRPRVVRRPHAAGRAPHLPPAGARRRATAS